MVRRSCGPTLRETVKWRFGEVEAEKPREEKAGKGLWSVVKDPIPALRPWLTVGPGRFMTNKMKY